MESAATNPAVSDRQLRVYTLVVAAFDRGVDARTVALTLPNVAENEAQASLLLGHLVSAGLLRKQLRTVGYRDGQRVRRGFYTLPGGDA